MAKGQEPTAVYVGASKDDRVTRWAKFLHIDLTWSHCFLFFLFSDGNEPVVYEASWRGVGPAPWDKAHQADGYAFFADDRMTPHSVSSLWWWCKGSEGKVYSFPRLLILVLRLAFQAWRRLIGGIATLVGISEVCSSFVNEGARAIWEEPYSERNLPSPDEIVASSHLHLVHSWGLRAGARIPNNRAMRRE